MYWAYQPIYLIKVIPFLGGWLADRLLGDPAGWPHPIVWFGKLISFGEKKLNRGDNRFYKGGLLTLVLVAGVYLLVHLLLYWAGLINTLFYGLLVGVGVFYCLAGKTLITEVKAVFEAVDRSVEEGRVQVGRIVGRDTSRFISPGDKGGCTGNTRRKPERRSDRPHVLVCFSGAARHDGLQNDQYARFDDRI